MSRRPEENLWYVHAPLKNEKRPVVEAPPPSNSNNNFNIY